MEESLKGVESGALDHSKTRFRPATLREIHTRALSKSTPEILGHRQLTAEYQAEVPISELSKYYSYDA